MVEPTSPDLPLPLLRLIPPLLHITLPLLPPLPLQHLHRLEQEEMLKDLKAGALQILLLQELQRVTAHQDLQDHREHQDTMAHQELRVGTISLCYDLT